MSTENLKNEISKKGTGIFVRENGGTKELTFAEAKERFPDTEIVEFDYEDDYVFNQNITHNLGKMASEAGLYEADAIAYNGKGIAVCP